MKKILYLIFIAYIFGSSIFETELNINLKFFKMARNPNTDGNGSSFSEITKRQVWNRGQIVAGIDPSIRRKDRCGAWIDWNQYGNTNENGTGWEIDHIRPVAKGGSDDLLNLQPLQWQNNRKKSDDYPASNYCIVLAK